MHEHSAAVAGSWHVHNAMVSMQPQDTTQPQVINSQLTIVEALSMAYQVQDLRQHSALTLWNMLLTQSC
jgi:hypothetical protein